MNEICQQCNLFKQCDNPMVEGIGSDDPDLIIVLPYPEKADEKKSTFTGERAAYILSAIGQDRLDNCYVTYAVKCPSYQSTISRDSFREPTDDEIKHCGKHLEAELARFAGKTILSFGKPPLKQLTNLDKIVITREVGIKRKIKFGGNEFALIPNMDPGAAFKNSTYKADLEACIERAFRSDDGGGYSETNINNKSKLLNFEDSMAEMDRVIKLFESGQIDHIIFDFETQGFDPWEENGEIIMASFAHALDEHATVIPYMVTNVIHHNDLSYEVPMVDFDITAIQKAKLLKKTGEMLEKIPISGHNLKFDLKWAAWKRICNVLKVKIFNDTFNISFQINSSGAGIDNSLKGQCRKHFEIYDDWEIKINDYINRFRLIKDRHYGMIPTGVLSEYSGLDSYYNKMLENFYLSTTPENLLKMADFVTSAIIPFVDSEVKGMAIDSNMFSFLKKAYTAFLIVKRNQIDDLPTVKKIIAKYIVPLQEKNSRKKVPLTNQELKEAAFNYRNPQKVSELFYDSAFYGMKCPKKFKTKAGGMKFDKEAREHFLENVLTNNNIEEEIKRPATYVRLKEAKSFLVNISSFKRVVKLLDDYIGQFPASMVDGLYKPSFNLNGTVTGRCSSPFHSMPNRCDLKRLVTSRWKSEGGLILAADQCLDGDTKIRLANGETPKISELVNRNEFYVYSVDSNGKICIGKGHSARPTISTTTEYRITLNTGDIINCTYNHRFMKKDHKYTEAKNLKIGDSLLHTEWRFKNTGSNLGKTILRQTDGTWPLSMDLAYNYGVKNGIFEPSSRIGMVVHHNDFNKVNDYPTNFAIIMKSKWECKTFRQKMTTIAKGVDRSMKWFHNSNPDRLKKLSDSLLRISEDKIRDNHRIVNIEVVEHEQPKQFYCLTVEDHHNFFLDNGVLSENSQLELRVIAALSAEKELIDSFRRGEDAHRFTASKMFGIPLNQVDDEQRQKGKAQNFGMVFGKTAETMAEDWGVTVNMAQKMIDDYYSRVPDLTTWMNKVKAETLETGYAYTVFGRRIPITTAFSNSKYDIAEAERCGVNYSVQSPATDLVMTGALEIWFRKQALKMKSVFLATVHDSMEYDIYPGELFDMMIMFKEEAQDKVADRHPWLVCPLHLEFELGTSWGGALKIEIEHLDSNSVVFKSKGHRKEIAKLKATASLAYDTHVEVLEEKPIKQSEFKEDIFCRDTVSQKVRFTIKKKSHS